MPSPRIALPDKEVVEWLVLEVQIGDEWVEWGHVGRDKDMVFNHQIASSLKPLTRFRVEPAVRAEPLPPKRSRLIRLE